jgi:hypothetical protein
MYTFRSGEIVSKFSYVHLRRCSSRVLFGLARVPAWKVWHYPIMLEWLRWLGNVFVAIFVQVKYVERKNVENSYCRLQTIETYLIALPYLTCMCNTTWLSRWDIVSIFVIDILYLSRSFLSWHFGCWQFGCLHFGHWHFGSWHFGR